MNIFDIGIDEIEPDRIEILNSQGIPEDSRPAEKLDQLLTGALELLRSESRPRGIILEIEAPQFENVFRGEGENETETPVQNVFRRADHLALYALTLGQEVSDKIAELFDKRDFALGYLLDSVASEAADKATLVVEKHYLDTLIENGCADQTTIVFGYSPGYCGWHISGQKKLFGFLKPGRIGISLGDSFLMQPLKSVSGVLIAGAREIHDFRDTFPFCSRCRSKQCLIRARVAI